VAFDVQNPEHRKWFAEFVKYNTWGRCPVRFMAESLDQDLVTYIEHKMLAYYVKLEFENESKIKIKTKSQSKSAPRTVRKKQSVSPTSGKKPARVSTPTQAS
jgi:hypothetical protein